MNPGRPLTLEQEQARIDAARDFFLSQGGSVKSLQSFEFKPLPARADRVDPETILKRRKKRLTLAERKILRKLAEAI